MQSRTDLALERAAGFPSQDGIFMRHRGNAFRITEIEIDSDEHGIPIGKPKGRYLTLETMQPHHAAPQLRNQVTELADELRSFIPEGAVLIAGLGNSDITPDALGPLTASHILATRHLRQELSDNDPDMDFLRAMRPVSVLANGVLGQTGIETAELIEALKDRIRPACVIAIDALACSDLHRLGTTIQISDAGISPGSGVRNSRAELSTQTLHVPVIAIGVPTVVDLHTVIRQADAVPPRDLPNLMVTPRDIDRLIHHEARLLALGINLALHPQLSYEDAEAL